MKERKHKTVTQAEIGFRDFLQSRWSQAFNSAEVATATIPSES
jgi:hypothetical protein